MLRVINYLADSKNIQKNGKFVHPFYRDTFSALYEIDLKDLLVEDGVYPDQNLKMLLPLIESIVKGYEDKIKYFYDVRTTEEFGYPAPEYLLLHRAGLRYVEPLAVKGMKALALPFALLLAECSMEDGEYALVCCAQLNTPFDENKKYEAGMILLDKISEYKGSDNNTMILSYNHNLCETEFKAYLDKHPVKTVCCDSSDFGAFFTELSNLPAKEELIFFWNLESCLGYIHIKKGVAE